MKKKSLIVKDFFSSFYDYFYSFLFRYVTDLLIVRRQYLFVKKKIVCNIIKSFVYTIYETKKEALYKDLKKRRERTMLVECLISFFFKVLFKRYELACSN